jgi:predicted secreted protein
LKNLKIVPILLLIVFSLSMISGVSAAQNTLVEHEKVNVNLNEKFRINLESNPSTGYIWIPEFDSEFIKLLRSEFKPIFSFNPENHIGEPGIQRFVFKPLKTCETEIIMKYVRPWSNEMPVEVVVYHVTINDN